MNLRSRPSYFAVALAAAVVAMGAAVVAEGVRMGVIDLRGFRLVAFMAGVTICAAGVFLFQRGVRRRARFHAIRALLPRAIDGSRRAWAMGEQGFRNTDAILFDDSDLRDDRDDRSERLPRVRAEIRAATRALLVSLEDEMRREIGWRRRSSRPACRRARLRAAGRSEPKRRRVHQRLATIPS